MYSHNSRWMIAVDAIQAARNYVPTGIVFYLAQPRLEGSLDLVVTVVFVVYSFTTAFSVFTRWATRLFTFNDRDIRHRGGLLTKTDVAIPWTSVVAIEVHKDPIRSFVGCCKVVIRASAGLDSEITLDTVRLELAEEIQRASNLAIAQAREAEAGLESTSREEAGVEHVFAASQRDMVAMSLAYWRFALFGPFIVAAYLELSQLTRLPEAEGLFADILSLNPISQLALLGGLTLTSVAYGYLVTLVRFWKFRAHITEGSLILEGGLFTNQRRAIQLDGVIGVVLKRNFLDVIMGRGRLALLTRDAGHVLGKNVVFPALRMREIEARIDNLRGGARELLALDRAPIRARGAWLIAAARVALLVAAAVAVLAVFDLWAYYAIAAVALILVSLVMVNACFTVVLQDKSGRGILYRRGLIWRSSYGLPLHEVQVFMSSTRPWDRWIGLRRMSLYYFSGRARKLFVWQPSR
ncbi:MAG: PH domain-containing protein [Actinobacteria bacterium]|nr:PH domain-containing protein [Actinomycetota bacterium]